MTLTLRALLGVEHLSPTGPKPYLPTRPVPLPVAPGDHLWLQIEAPEPVWLTGLLDDRAARFRRVFVVPPGGAHAHRPLGAPLVVTDELSGFRTLWIVASRRELPGLSSPSTVARLTTAHRPPSALSQSSAHCTRSHPRASAVWWRRQWQTSTLVAGGCGPSTSATPERGRSLCPST